MDFHAKDGNIFQGSTVSANNILWALGNYSFFIRPDYQRIALEGADDLNTLVGSAYIVLEHKRMMLVFVNSGHEAEKVKITLPKKYRKRLPPPQSVGWIKSRI